MLFSVDRVVAIEQVAAADDATSVPVDGCVVVPGLVDLHSHVFDGIGDSVDPDVGGLGRGTTTTVDGGSAGAASFAAFRRVVAPSRTRVLAWLNLSSIGQVDLRVGELLAAPWLDVEAAVTTARANPDLVVGFKARLSTYVAGGTCKPVLRLLRESADAAQMPVMVHIGDTGEPLSEILPLLRAGDVVTHCFTGRKFGILQPDGVVLPAVFEARQRGVLFDSARGRNHMAHPVVQAAVEQSFLPDSVSTDITRVTAADPAFGQPLMGTHLLSFGVSFEDVVSRMTLGPARALGRQDLGRLGVGGIGDATVLRLEAGRFALQDVDGRVRHTDRRMVAVGVVRSGVYTALSGSQPGTTSGLA